ncbi:hypothetical protein ACXX81_10760 [Pseudomonas sp. GNP013]
MAIILDVLAFGLGKVMGYFVTVTFDLKAVGTSPNGTNVYKKISRDLDDLEYSKVVSGKKKKTLKLPSNIYVVEFEDKFKDRTKVIEFVESELKKIFKRHTVAGKYFIFAGKDWAWKTGKFSRRTAE